MVVVKIESYKENHKSCWRWEVQNTKIFPNESQKILRALRALNKDV